MMNEMLSPSKCCEAEYMPTTVKDTLLKRKQSLEAQLAKVNKAIETLDKNPGFVEAFDSLRGLI